MVCKHEWEPATAICKKCKWSEEKLMDGVNRAKCGACKKKLKPDDELYYDRIFFHLKCAKKLTDSNN